MAKEGYKPTAGMKAAARKAIKFKEDGKAKGAGTAVGWTRARQLVNGETLSLSTVKRMYSFFSRHEVDKKGKDWGNQANPSNGYIMWLAWGGDAGFSWSRKIVNREKNVKKTIVLDQELVEEIKTMLEDAVDPITEEIEIEEDVEFSKSMGEEDKEDEEDDKEDEDHWDEDLQKCWTGYVQRGMKEKGGRMVPNCVPVKKAMALDVQDFLKEMKEKYNK